MTGRDTVAAGLATALLAGSWTRPQVTRRCAAALGRTSAAPWMSQLCAAVTEAYRDAPRDRPRELAAFLQTTAAWRAAWDPASDEPAPKLVAVAPQQTRMATARWPVTELHDLADLARLLDVDQGELAWFADTRRWQRRAARPLRHYRWRAVPRPDGVRLLAAPKPRLKEIQRRLLRHVFAPVAVHGAAHGGVRGCSVRTALSPHAGSDVVVKLDLEAFFPSVPAGRVWGVLRTAGYPEQVAHTITGLVTTIVPYDVWRAVPVGADLLRHDRLGRALARPHLPQGAPTSPAAANLVTFALDRRLTGLAESFGARYTRYVDDLIFSGGSGLTRGRSIFVGAVERIVQDEGWRLNERKTVVLRSSGRQQALGAVLNARPSLPRSERDALRAILHNCAVRGCQSQARGRSLEQFRAHLVGRVAAAAGLDPEFGARLAPLVAAIDWGRPAQP